MNIKKTLFSTLAIASALTLTTVSTFAATTTSSVIQPNYAVGGGDVTSTFTTKMRQNAAYMAYYAQMDEEDGTYPLLTGEEFASKVQTNGDWDYKEQYGSTTEYLYNGINLTGDDLGNMNYGFAGRGGGFTKTELDTAAGAYQIYSGTSYIGWYTSYFDDPSDQYWINYGISMFDNNSWPQTSSVTVEPNSVVAVQKPQIDTSLFNLLSQYEKKQIEAKFKAAAAKLKHNQKSGQ